MTDGMSISSALAALKTATDMVKVLRAADGAFDKAELKIKVAGLAEPLADARMALLDAQSEMVQLRERIAQLERATDSRGTLVKRPNVYWFTDGAAETGPFCPRCFEMKQVRMPVTELPSTFRDMARYRCPECRATY